MTGRQRTIGIITPAPRGSRAGNRVSAIRYYAGFRRLGYRVQTRVTYENQPWDCLIALHAQRSHNAVIRFRERHPSAPIILVLTGTDIYESLPAGDPDTLESIELATVLVTLQPLAIATLPPEHHHRVRTIYQSVGHLGPRPAPRDDVFEVCVIGHLRPVKDSLRTAAAARLLPPSSRIDIVHVGGAMTAAMADAAQREQSINPRYRWLGERSRGEAMEILLRSRLLSHTSLLEGGANVVSEAIVAGTPVLASRIDGTVGLLGDDYPGYFKVEDTAALAALLSRAERDTDFYDSLHAALDARRPLFMPESEMAAWRELLGELV